LIYLADLHVHSRFSRATARDCNLSELAYWASVKGLDVIATGDFTHPEWRQEISEMLVESRPGLFRLKPEFSRNRSDDLPGFNRKNEVLFMLNVEISSIYKREGTVRKVHNLVFAPDIESMGRISSRLERIGNIRSDGRPIIGLDSRDLLEIALECSPESFVVPAHIWTPWFSVLGSKSGFDSVEECYRDLSPHVFALETGLSSDPAMNYRLSSLDGYTLISNSDTHSPSRLGREANIFWGSPSYPSIRSALRNGSKLPSELTKEAISACYFDQTDVFGADEDRLVGTVEFFPEEGKYHVDGHRKCSTRLDPCETRSLNERCPVCGHPVTVGVMNRVEQLADRDADFQPAGRPPFWSMLPLQELLGQVFGTGPNSKKVLGAYSEMIRRLGTEIPLLCFKPLDMIAEQAPSAIVEALRRVRMGEVRIKPGYDGQYGTVELFQPGEMEYFNGQLGFFAVSRESRKPLRDPAPPKAIAEEMSVKCSDPPKTVPIPKLNHRQRMAATAMPGPVLVQAGPGSGKTLTLVQRISHLLKSGLAAPSEIITVTFTRKAADEIRARLQADCLFPEGETSWVGTFHELGLRILKLSMRQGLFPIGSRVIGETEAKKFFGDALNRCQLPHDGKAASRLRDQVSRLKQAGKLSGGEWDEKLVNRIAANYDEILRDHSALDLDDLICRPLELLRANPRLLRELAGIWKHILVDEFQDVNRVQYELFRLLAGATAEGAFCIGDPDQAIYGFRGADKELFFQVPQHFPFCTTIHLNKNYRSQEHVLTAARAVLGNQYSNDDLVAVNQSTYPVKIVKLRTMKDEGRHITRTIEALVGGSSFDGVHSLHNCVGADGTIGFRDVAVLYRLNTIGDSLEKVFRDSGIPYQRSRRKKPEEEADFLDLRAETVTLMTMHAAKGLEFPVVFIAGCEDGLMPFEDPTGPPLDQLALNEERRLLYVAMTRAQRILYISLVSQRSLFGSRLKGDASRFLPWPLQAPYELHDLACASQARNKPREKQCGLFD